ncbi:uncharacterized protein LOC120087577 [Benincasa hispida]|uniref:uncharacterized protein LOC120087577 n=1 Tax=Benincasa hispida TaxID=102211 RepID=UPI0018FFFBD3|nr:uncharacterized protein LOC120087577 [Benincasa hispida]
MEIFSNGIISIEEGKDSVLGAPYPKPFFTHKVSFPALEILRIDGGNSLEMLWNKNKPIASSFCKLREISIENCNKLRCMFPWSIVKSLAFLETLNIFSCELLERIFETEKRSFATEEEENGEIVFNRLSRLEFDNLPSLLCFHSGKCTLKFVALNFLKIRRCHDMKTFSYGITNTPNLQAVEIGENEVPVSPTKGINDIIQAFFTQEIEFLQSMRDVELRLKRVKRGFWHKLNSFPQLECLRLIGCEDDDMVCLPSEVSEVLYNIRTFKIENALQLVHVFENEVLTTNNHVQRCAKLKEIYLWDLPKLTHVWKESSEVITVSLDSLEHMEVRRCENLKCIVPSSFSFLNLRTLIVNNCNRMVNLFSSSVANNLENLEKIEISDCTGMTSIVIADEENGEIIFKKLRCLGLDNLPRLFSFYSGKCMLKFPSLETLDIFQCNQMETFSVGMVSTASLESMTIGESEFIISPTRDINVIIQHIFTDRNRMEGSKEKREG